MEKKKKLINIMISGISKEANATVMILVILSLLDDNTELRQQEE